MPLANDGSLQLSPWSLFKFFIDFAGGWFASSLALIAEAVALLAYGYGLAFAYAVRQTGEPAGTSIRQQRLATVTLRSQVPPLLLVPCGSRLYPVWIPASGPYRLSRILTSGVPDVPDTRPSIARRRSTSLSTVTPTSESVRNLLTGLRPSVRFPSPWRTRWPSR